MTTQDKEAVELEEAAITHAGYVFQQVRGFVPDEFTWKDAQCGKELGAYGAAFLLGVEWQKQRERPHECPNQQVTPIEQCSHEDCQKPVNGELEVG